jgi:phosphatidylethanolamine/phosphatidyl-N-methylethanolamine N-methyltransferase
MPPLPRTKPNLPPAAASVPVSKRWRSHNFLAAWMRSPLKVGAVLPSSRALTHAMAGQVNLAAEGTVVELGAGTGVITQALLHAGVPNQKLAVVERDPKLHALLCTHYPQLQMLCGDAMHLQALLEEAGVQKVSAIVSSLPLMSMPKEVKQGIEEQLLMLSKLHDADIIQFTYGPVSPIGVQMLHKHGVVGKRVKFVMANIPPAHVWVYRAKH